MQRSNQDQRSNIQSLDQTDKPPFDKAAYNAIN